MRAKRYTLSHARIAAWHLPRPDHITLEDVVREVRRTILRNNDIPAWERLLGDFCKREVFGDQYVHGSGLAGQFLGMFGGWQLVHGHTPITYVTYSLPKQVTSPLLYAGGLYVNVDGGMYLGGPAFVYQLPRPQATREPCLAPAGLDVDAERE